MRASGTLLLSRRPLTLKSRGGGDSQSLTSTVTVDDANTTATDDDTGTDETADSVSNATTADNDSNASTDNSGDTVNNADSVDGDYGRVDTGDNGSSDDGIMTLSDDGDARNANDVSILDSLDSDSASVSELTVADIVSGTAPFDKNDDAGNDSSADNNVIRSFDRATYTLRAVTTSDDPMTYYRTARIGFRVRIPVSAGYAVLDTDDMGWVDNSSGYAPSTVANDDGSQTVTVYRLVEATSSSPTSVPGTYELPFIIDVKALTQGESFQPSFEAFMVPNTDTGRAASVTADALTVSSRPQFNVRIEKYAQSMQNSGGANGWDFTTKDSDGYYDSDNLNSELGVAKGTLTMLVWDIEILADDATKGVRGTELPKAGTTISFDMYISNSMKLYSSGKYVYDAAFQPYFWMVTAAGDYQNATRNSVMREVWTPRTDFSTFPYATKYNGDSIWRNIYNAGHMRVEQNRTDSETVLTVSTDDWVVDPTYFPKRVPNYGSLDSCSTTLMMSGTAPCNEYRRMVVSGGYMFWMNPTTKDGESVTQIYNDSVSVYSTVTTPSISVTGESGATTTTQTATSDDKVSTGNLVEPNGSFSMTTWYSCSKEPWVSSVYNGTTCSGWRGSDLYNGTDKSYPGARIRIQVAANASNGNTTSLASVLHTNFLKFDDKALEFDGNLNLRNPSENIANIRGVWDGSASGHALANYEGEVDVRYAVKKDGTGWTSDKEQAEARITDMDFYRTLDEAEQHGTPVGLLIVSHDTAPLRSMSNFFQPSFMLHVRDDAQVGYTAQITQEAHAYTRQALVDAGVTPSGLTVDSSRTDWFNWAMTIDPLELSKTVPWTYTDTSDNYVKSTYDADGNYIQGTEGQRYGDTLLISSEKATLSVTTAQKDANGNPKTLYDLDKEERYVDWRVPVLLENKASNSTTTLKTNVTLTITIPSGMTMLDGSAHWDSKYAENSQSYGSFTSGRQLTPVDSGTTSGKQWFKFTVENYPVDDNYHNFYITTVIGDASDPENDAVNGQSYALQAEVVTTRDTEPPTTYNQKLASYTVSVSRTRASQLGTRANPLIVDANNSVGFIDMIANSSSNDKTGMLAVDQLPVNGSNGSSYHGTTTLSALQLTGYNASLTGNITVKATTLDKYSTVDPSTITAAQVSSSDWAALTINSDGSVTIPSTVDASRITALAFQIATLPANSRINATITITTSGNQPRDLYVNRLTDTDNTVEAMSTVANRVISGVVFVDGNMDGARATSDDLVPDITVSLVKKTDTANTPATLLDGTTATTTTDSSGAYEFNNVPSGDYKLVFTSSDMRFYRLTIKQADGVSSDLNSDADGHINLNTLTSASITLDTLPTVDNLTSSTYTVTHMDVGLIRVASTSTLPSTGANPYAAVILLVTIVLTVLMGALYALYTRKPTLRAMRPLYATVHTVHNC